MVRAHVVMSVVLVGASFAHPAFAGEPAPREAPSGEPAPAEPPSSDDLREVERLHAESQDRRRTLATAVLVGGATSVVGGALLMVPDGDDQAWRFAGFNTVIFGAIDAVIGGLSLRDVAKADEAWNAPAAAAARRTRAGLSRTHAAALADARKESVAYAVNLGLDGAYLSVATMAVVVSRLGVSHPDRWFASGVAIGVQSLFLVAVDVVGITNAGRTHAGHVHALVPQVAVVPTASGTDAYVGIRAAF
ncbi:MAG: hypothetical protein U0169_04695 [Polyangiaceae bacterium]